MCELNFESAANKNIAHASYLITIKYSQKFNISCKDIKGI